jgi:K+-transporting ATPase ATPase A chain
VFNAMRYRTTQKLGNFYNYFVKSITRILLPLSFILAVFLVFNGTPATFEGKAKVLTVEGDSVPVSRGPVAPLVAIKQLGTNGGGFFGANSAHPFENPDYFTNMLENSAIFLIPVAMIFALGYYLKKKRLAWTIFMVMTAGFLLLLIPSVYMEMKDNPVLTGAGIHQSLGNMEGKEVRFGSAASAFWGITTTSSSNGSVNAMHDSFMPLPGMAAMLGMMINSLYGGVGVGFLNYYIFIIITVFIAGLMVGRTPEFLGRKIEAREIKIAVIVALLHPLLILSGTAISAYMMHKNPGLGWLGNPGFHGFSEMLYEYSSASANNGSAFAGISDNNTWWNLSTSVVLLISRYIPIIGPVAIAGLLARKKIIPDSLGTLQTDSTTFGVMTFVVIFIIAALSFFPALTLGPIAEHFNLFYPR